MDKSKSLACSSMHCLLDFILSIISLLLHCVLFSNLLGIWLAKVSRSPWFPGVNLISKISIFWVNIIGGFQRAKSFSYCEDPTQQETYPLDMAHLSMQRPPTLEMQKIPTVKYE